MAQSFLFQRCKNIRAAQVESLVAGPIKSEKVSVLDYKTADKKIQETGAMSVMFAKPSGKQYDQMVKLFNSDKMNEFHRSLYIYPLIYNAGKAQEQYNVSGDEITLVFFENGKEKDTDGCRKIYGFKTQLIPELNRLPMAGVLKDQQKRRKKLKKKQQRPRKHRRRPARLALLNLLKRRQKALIQYQKLVNNS